MKKKMRLMLMAALSSIGAMGITIDPTQNQFFFENKEEALLKSAYEWDVSVRPGRTTKTSGTVTFSAILGQPHTTVEDWGLSDTKSIWNAVWQGVPSTNFTYSFTSGGGEKYLYLFARWYRYGLTFDAVAGEPSNVVTNGLCYTNSVALPVSSRTGYDFAGWTNGTVTAALTGTGTGADFGVADDGTNITLYARWEPKTYTVTFDANGAGATATAASLAVTYDSAYGELPAATRPGYAFAGWFTDPAAGTQITADTVVSITENQTLYAQWRQLFTVTFQSTGGTIYKQYTDVEYGASVAPPDVSEIDVPAGKVFNGWSSGAYENVTGNLIIYPNFLDVTTVLSAWCDPTAGGSLTIENNGEQIYGRQVTLTVTANPGYDFIGWSDGSAENPRIVEVVADTNLVARLSLRRLTVDFVDFDGETPLDSQTVDYGAAAARPADPQRTGYTFTDWSAAFDNVISNMTIVAQYAANRYTVIYDANGGSGAMTNDVFTYDQEYTLQPNAYTRALAEFSGWASTPDAATNEVEYADQAIVSNLTAVAGATNRLYAVWGSLLSDYSQAADCTNLVLACANANKKWGIDHSAGFASTSSVCAAGERVALMTTVLPEAGTLTFRVKCAKSALSSTVTVFDFYDGTTSSGTDFYVKIDDTDGEWVLCSYVKENSAAKSVTWRFSGWSDDDSGWVDQVHWYPGRSVEVPGNNIDSTNRAEVSEAILSNWDAILGENAASVSTVVATGPAVTNAVALLAAGFLPAVETAGSSATLTFTEHDLDLAIRISAFAVTDLPTASLEASISPHDTQPTVGLWGAPTLTSGWSQVESEGDFSRFVDEGIVAFEFNVSTNRFFKIIAQ